MEFQRKLRYKGMNVYNFLVQIGHTFVILFLENIALKSTKSPQLDPIEFPTVQEILGNMYIFEIFNSAPTV